MNFESLKYLLAVAKQRSFTKAANSLSISQQGLSKSIKHLEDELGFKLLDRSGRQVVMTAAARELEPEIGIILDAYQELQAKALHLRAAKIDEHGNYRVFATAFFTEVIFGILDSDLVASGLDKVPITEEDIDQILAAIESNPRNTAALVNMIPDTKGEATIPREIIFERIFSIESVVAADTKLLSPRIKTITRKHLKDLPLAYLNEPLFNQATAPLFEYYQPQNIIRHTSNLDRLYKSVEKGKVVMITDSLQAYTHSDADGIMFFPMDKPVYTNIGFLYGANVDLEPELQLLIETLRDLIHAKWHAYIKHHPPIP